MQLLKTGLLLTVLTLLFVAVGSWLGGPSGAVVALVLALVMNLVSFWYSDRIVLAMTRARPLDRAAAPNLYAMTERLAQAAGIPTPRLYVIPDPQPNAFATGRSPAHGVVAVNQGLIELLDARELEGVIAHEIAHIKHRDTLTMAVAAALAGAVMTLVNIAQWTMIFGGGDDEEQEGGLAGLLVAMLVAPLAATLLQLALSRAREFEADRSATRYVGSPEGLVGALSKLEAAALRVPTFVARPATAHLFIVNPLRAGGGGGTHRFARLFMTHPPVAERVARLRALAAPAHTV